jgi:hypothetical protein
MIGSGTRDIHSFAVVAQLEHHGYRVALRASMFTGMRGINRYFVRLN